MHAQAQAAYCNTQQPGSRMNPNPQHIADSIYNMAAHVSVSLTQRGSNW